MLLLTFAPPPNLQSMPQPCPACDSMEGLPLYATSRAQYYRCTCCQQIWAHTNSDHPAPAAA